MSRRNRTHKNREMQHNTNMLGGVNLGNAAKQTAETVSNAAKQTAETVAGTVNNNRLLIGGLAAGCGVAIFLLATDAGRRARSEISERAADMYDFMSDQVTNAWERIRGLIPTTISEEDVAEVAATVGGLQTAEDREVRR